MEITGEKKVVGFNQTKKHIISKKAKKVFVAKDADAAFIRQITDLCVENGVEYDVGCLMDELGKACGINVNCAVCAVLQ